MIFKQIKNVLKIRSQQLWNILTCNWKMTLDGVWNLEPVSIRWKHYPAFLMMSKENII